MHYIYNSYSLHYQVKPESVSLHYFMAILVRWFYFFNWKNKSSFQQLFIKICYLKSLTFSLHLKRTLNNSQHINSDDTYMWIMSSLVLWNKMLTTKLHIFLSSEKYLIIITTPFLKWLWTLVKMERRGLVLSCRKGQSRDQDDGIERGCQEISLWQVRSFSEIHVTFFLLTDFVTVAIHLIFPQTILRLEFKMPDRTDSNWYVCLKKMNIESTQYVYHEFQKRRGGRPPCMGEYQEGGMIPLFKLCWHEIWSSQSNEINCFPLIHSLMTSNLQNPF